MVAEQNGSSVAQLKVGFLGLGIMGTGMVRNLMKAGFASVTVWNRSIAKVGPDRLGRPLCGGDDLPQLISSFTLPLTQCGELKSEGALVGESPMSVMQSCDIVFAMLADIEAATTVIDLGGLVGVTL
jgi:3-hydroxyisobutyrate dehydrogenase-like beta-hydroxyacid dehydrogenase